MRGYNSIMPNLSRDFLNFKKLFFFFTALLLTSCLTVNSELELKNNGSGTLKMSYTLDKSLNGISNLDSEEDIVPLNLSEDYINGIVNLRDDISYRDYNISEDELNYIVDVTFDFDTIDGLNSMLPEDNRVVITNVGKDTVFKQVIVKQATDEITSENMEIFRDIFKRHSFSLKVKTPKDIIKVDNGVEVSKRVAIYQESFIDVISDPNKKEWSIRW